MRDLHLLLFNSSVCEYNRVIKLRPRVYKSLNDFNHLINCKIIKKGVKRDN